MGAMVWQQLLLLSAVLPSLLMQLGIGPVTKSQGTISLLRGATRKCDVLAWRDAGQHAYIHRGLYIETLP